MVAAHALSGVDNGCYEATRAAALAGVPKSTLYWWANHDIVVPSISPVRERLWSYSDLMAVRLVSWLRRPKPSEGTASGLPASPMTKVREALALVEELRLDLWGDAAAGVASPLLVDSHGEIYVRVEDTVFNVRRQPTLLPADVLGLTAPFSSGGVHGPDLLQPRPHLRIVPSKVAGEPHIEHSRLTTQAVAALAGRGYSIGRIADLYGETEEAIVEAIDLEQQLAQGMRPAA